MNIKIYQDVLNNLKENELSSYLYPNEKEIESLLIELPEVPNTMGVLAVSFDEPFENYFLAECNLYFFEIENYAINIGWYNVINMINLSVPFSGFYLNNDGISYKFSFPIGKDNFEEIKFHLMSTIQMLVYQHVRVYDLVYQKLLNIDLNNEEIVHQILEEFDESWNTVK
jgi:hypothetical protein